MADDPTSALREKPEASITVAARLVAEGSASGMVSAGSTGAAMAAAAIIIGRIPGVSRPAIASIVPTPGPDGGARFGGQSRCHARAARPVRDHGLGGGTGLARGRLATGRVALQWRGEGQGTGPGAGRIRPPREREPVNFIGNVEGRDIGTERADVIVTDGFTGNIFIKTMEGAARMIGEARPRGGLGSRSGDPGGGDARTHEAAPATRLGDVRRCSVARSERSGGDRPRLLQLASPSPTPWCWRGTVPSSDLTGRLADELAR